MAMAAVRGTTHRSQIWNQAEATEAISFVGPKPLVLLFYCTLHPVSPDVIKALRRREHPCLPFKIFPLEVLQSLIK